MSARSGLSDWLCAIQELKPAGDDELNAIAGLLGLSIKSPKKMLATPSRRSEEKQRKIEGGESLVDRSTVESKPRPRRESVLASAEDAPRNPAPEWLVAARLLGTADPARMRASLPLEPLFPVRTSRAILSGALATPSANGPLNLNKAIELLSRAETITEMPRLSLPTLARGAQLLIDRGPGMQPFAADQAVLRNALVNVVGNDRTQILYFEGSPLFGAGLGPKDDWPEYQAPAPKTPVVALTDLGIAQPPGVAGLAGASDWTEFAKILARAGCPLLAFVPYPRERWPARLSRHMTIVQWDRATTATVIRREIPTGLRAVKET